MISPELVGVSKSGKYGKFKLTEQLHEKIFDIFNHFDHDIDGHGLWLCYSQI